MTARQGSAASIEVSPLVDEDAEAMAHAASFVGQVIAGRYRIDEVIAMGGLGAVLKSEHVHMRKRVAVKVLHPSSQGLPELVLRFERESVVGAHAAHPNVASATDFGQLDDGTYYLVLEYIEGITLHELMQRGPLPIERAAAIARQIALALAAVHKLDIFHRDLKPRNVMVIEGTPDAVKLIDFGFAKVPLERFSTAAESIKVTARGTVFGTIGYMAPEAMNGMQAVTDRSDLYALGVILYEMLTGTHPFDKPSLKELFRHHQLTRPPSFHERAPDRSIPRAFEAITLRLLEKRPEDRYPSADAVVDAIDEALRSKEPDLPEPSVEAEPARHDGGEPPSPIDPAGAAKADVEPPAAETISKPRSRGRGVLPLTAALLIAGGAVAMSPSLRGSVMQTLGMSAQPVPTASASMSSSPAPSVTASAEATASVVTASASVAASASASATPEPSTIDGLDGARWRRVLQDAVTAQDTSRGAKALLALVQIDPSAFGESPVVAAAAAVAVPVAFGDPKIADSVYDALSGERIGGGGPDVLFQITSFYGGSKGAKRAAELLRRPEVLERATPALRVTMALREASSCKDKIGLFDRAAREGDGRTLALLEPMRAPDCENAAGVCCMSGDPRLDMVLTQLRGRLQK